MPRQRPWARARLPVLWPPGTPGPAPPDPAARHPHPSTPTLVLKCLGYRPAAGRGRWEVASLSPDVVVGWLWAWRVLQSVQSPWDPGPTVPERPSRVLKPKAERLPPAGKPLDAIGMPGPRELLCGSWFSGLGDQRTWPTKRMPWWREWRWGFCSGLEQGRGARRRGADPQRPSRALGAGSQSRALRVPGALRGGSLGRVESATRRRRHGTSFLPLDSRLRAPV